MPRDYGYLLLWCKVSGFDNTDIRSFPISQKVVSLEEETTRGNSLENCTGFWGFNMNW